MIELTVVIAIIAVLAVVAIPSLTRAITNSKASRAMAEFRTIDTAANAIFADLGVYPAEGPWCVGPGFVNIADVPPLPKAPGKVRISSGGRCNIRLEVV